MNNQRLIEFRKLCAENGFELAPGSDVVDVRGPEEEAIKSELVRDAKERFGEIVNGDVFDVRQLGLGTAPLIFKQPVDAEWHYEPKSDTLSLGGFRLYRGGVWAERRPPLVEITAYAVEDVEDVEDIGRLDILFKFSRPVTVKDRSTLLKALEQRMGYYLNNIEGA